MTLLSDSKPIPRPARPGWLSKHLEQWGCVPVKGMDK